MSSATLPRPRPAHVGRNASPTRPGTHAAGTAADASTFEHLDPAVIGNQRQSCLGALRQGDDPQQAERTGLELDDEAAGARWSG